ncbi:hypothetical protein Tsubulata_046989 [Turnera subulata]|uniref:F-box domain-containing protein n=1 Tax=Turnera subulata TaxID=218843 RepID=A0A9Q0G5H8_9ROSI|nr:hypothetical protein Tsubulata_046989 [Turnera subulata]
MSDSEIIMSLSGTSTKRKRDERLLVDQANNCLPLDIVEELLAMLPTKSINRFMSVSKSWFSLLVSADFQKFRCKYTPPPPETILAGVPKLLRNHNSAHLRSASDGFKLSSYCNIETPTRESYPIQKFYVNNFRHGPFLGSCNGLVCLEHQVPVINNLWKPEIVVWNPFTGLYRKLPDHVSSSSALISYNAYGFGYVSASDDYKVFLATGANRVDCFSLKAGSWREVEVGNPDRNKYLQYLKGGSMGLFSNGTLHWESKNEEDGSARIVAFDLGKEKFYDVPLPSHHQLSPHNYGYKYYSLGVVGEYLCVSFFATDHQRPANIVLVMKEYCNAASWAHFVSYSPNGVCERTYVSDSIPISGKDGGYIGLQYSVGFFATDHQRPANIVLVMKEYCNAASWAHFVSYSPNGVCERTYVSDSIPISGKDGGYIGLQYSVGYIDVLHWINNNPDEESDEAVEHSKKKVIKFFHRHNCWSAIPYTEALTSPYGSTSIDQGIFEHPSQKKACLCN